MFCLDPAFRADISLCDLELSTVLLKPIKEFKWFLLVPRVTPAAKNLLSLSETEKYILFTEINIISEIVNACYKPDQINIAMLGNKVEQLHVHIIARFKNDPAWPNAVFEYNNITALDELEIKNESVKFLEYHKKYYESLQKDNR